jgi:hypothetical protein
LDRIEFEPLLSEEREPFATGRFTKHEMRKNVNDLA